MSPRVMVHGASGHTGRFVVRELLRRGVVPVLAGRDADRLRASTPPGAVAEVRVVDLLDPVALGVAMRDIDVVVNCAGPFLDTALPLARAAVVAGAHYLDVTAEQPAASGLYRELDGPARDAGVAVVPAMAFYGGLADLMVTAALDGDAAADEVDVAIGLDHWWPTEGTRRTGTRNTAPRQVIREGRLVPLATPAPTSTWPYPAPLGEQPVVELPFSEVVTIHRHLAVGRLRSYLNTASLHELRDASTPAPAAADEEGRSAQRFVVDVRVRVDGASRGVRVQGRDIYAVSAPIVVEGALVLLAGRHLDVGALAPGQAFEASAVLRAVEVSGGVEVDWDVDTQLSGRAGAQVPTGR